MPRKVWKYSEVKLLIENYNKTTEELTKLLPSRNKKSINRKLENLREEGKVGHRSTDTIKRAYLQRKRGRGKKIDTVCRGTIADSFEPIEETYYEEVD